MQLHQKVLIVVFAALAFSFAGADDAHAQGKFSLGMESDLDTASLLYRISGPFSLGVRFGISNANPAPMLRYNFTNVRGVRLFFHAEANGFELGGGKGKKKKGKGGKGGGLDDFALGIGAEYIIKRRLSLFGVITNDGNFLGLQFYF